MKKLILALTLVLTAHTAHALDRVFDNISAKDVTGAVWTVYTETIQLVDSTTIKFFIGIEEVDGERTAIKIVYNCVEHLHDSKYLIPDSLGRYLYDGACSTAYDKTFDEILRPKLPEGIEKIKKFRAKMNSTQPFSNVRIIDKIREINRGASISYININSKNINIMSEHKIYKFQK